MKVQEYSEFLRSRGQNEQAIGSALDYVREFAEYLSGKDKGLDTLDVEEVKAYAAELIADGKNTMDRFLALARYVYMAGLNDAYIYFTAILGGREVVASISEKLAKVAGEDTRTNVFDDIHLPPLGSPPEEYPRATARLVSGLQELGQAACREVLADNHHGVPVQAFDKHKKWLREAGSIDAFLKKVHGEAVAELERYMSEGKIWYEQKITPEVVEFVKGNQEVLSAVREGKYLYITKIPYAPDAWLKESDPMMKRYLACHCPLARAALITGEPRIPLDWCYCSGGFEKLMFDVVFDEPTEVEVLESVLAGDHRCRFRVKIPEARL
jgi:hypothetical protein